MKDFFGQELSIGDEVAVTPKNYRGLITATVVKFTPTQVRVIYPWQSWMEEYLVSPKALIKAPKKGNSDVED